MIQDASSLSNETYQMTGKTGSLRYMAPEVARDEKYNHKVDVYSYGILLWELLSCKKPFVSCDLHDFIQFVIDGGARPDVDKNWPVDVQNLIHSCWSVDIEKRPSFSRIVTVLDSLYGDGEVMGSRQSSLSSLFEFKSERGVGDESKAARRNSFPFF